jgi:hypothetical protein
MKKLCLAFGVFFACLSFTVFALSSTTISFQDLDGDEDPDLAVINASFHTGFDSILVFDEGDDMTRSQDWEVCCNFRNDAWIFDAGSDGDAELIIDFDDREKLTAYIYEDLDGDGIVSYHISNTLKILEGNFSSRIVAKNNRWSVNNTPDFSVEILSNKDTPNIYSYYDTDDDGAVDLWVWDFGNGKDWYEKWKSGYVRSGKVGNEVYTTPYVYWPLLNTVLLVDWSNAKTELRELLPKSMEDSYDIILPGLTEGAYKWAPVDTFMKKEYLKNRIRYGWENPSAYYDLAGDNDSEAELIVRMVDDPAYETRGEKIKGKRFYEFIRYIWNQGAHGWYRITLVGKNEYNTVIKYPFGQVRTMPFEEAPYWIYERKWYGQVFASADVRQVRGPEDLYENQFYPYKRIHENFRDPQIKLPEYVPSSTGIREEYTFDYYGAPMLYLSPIDRRLHLKHATKGMIIVNTTSEMKDAYGVVEGTLTTTEKIVYENLDGDEYLDKWVHYVEDEPVKHLIYTRGFLIYGDRGRAKLLRIGVINQSLMETIPPRNHEEWVRLSRRLDAYSDKTIGLMDFDAMFNQFLGEPVIIEGGYIKDFNLTEIGFMASLDCVPICVVTPSTAVRHEKPLSAGKYLLTYDGNLSIIRPMPPDLEIRESDVSLSNETPRELEYVTIKARITNRGNHDIGPVVVQFFEGDARGEILIGNETISGVPAGGSVTVSHRWLAKPRVKEIHVRVDPDDVIPENDEENNIASHPVTVTPLPLPPAEERVMINTSEDVIRVLLVLVVGMVLLTFYIARTVL